LNRPLTALDQQTQKQVIYNILERAKKAEPKPAIISALANPQLAGLFERVVVFDRGALAGDGTFTALAAGNSVLKGLLQ
jgi:putative ABC transport system ATP-binding protein